MKLLLIASLAFFLQTGYGAVYPIKDVSIINSAEASYLKAKVFLEDSCMKLDGNSLLFDSRQKVVTLVQEVRNTPRPVCAQMIAPKTSEFVLHHLPEGVFDLVDGFDNYSLGLLWVKSNGEVRLLEE